MSSPLLLDEELVRFNEMELRTSRPPTRGQLFSQSSKSPDPLATPPTRPRTHVPRQSADTSDNVPSRPQSVASSLVPRGSLVSAAETERYSPYARQSLINEMHEFLSDDTTINWGHIKVRKMAPMMAKRGSNISITMPASLVPGRSSKIETHPLLSVVPSTPNTDPAYPPRRISFAEPIRRKTLHIPLSHMETVVDATPGNARAIEVEDSRTILEMEPLPDGHRKLASGCTLTVPNINVEDDHDDHDNNGGSGSMGRPPLVSKPSFKRPRASTRWQQMTEIVKSSNKVAPERLTPPPVKQAGFMAEEMQRADFNIDKASRFAKPVEASIFRASSRLPILDPAGAMYMYWLAIITLAVLYNTWTVILRVAFHLDTSTLHPMWLTFDYFCDFLYILDIFVRMRTGFIMHGLMVTDSRLIFQTYIQKRQYMDIISVIPLELLFFPTGYHVALRFNRLLKAHRWMRFESKFEHRTNRPGIWRLVFLMHKLVLVTHYDACCYYLICTLEGLGTNNWVLPSAVWAPNVRYFDPSYSGVLKQYLASMYWSTSLLMTVGVSTTPVTSLEFLFLVLNNILGVIMFGVLVGNIGIILSNINKEKSSFQNTVDRTKQYMTSKKFPQDFQEQVKRWYDYVWTRYNTLNEQEDLLSLPSKLQADMALLTHIEALKRVKLFENCGEYILRVAAMSLKQRIYNPGDYIVLKNEIGMEMYIIQDGIVEVLDFQGDEEIVYATLTAGQYFGELALLSMNVGSRRTAYVRSVGYAEVFVMHKSDLQSILASDSSLRINLANRASKLLGDISVEHHEPKPSLAEVCFINDIIYVFTI